MISGLYELLFCGKWILGSQGTIEFIRNCFLTVNKYWSELGLSSAPELIFIEEINYLHNIKKILKN